MAELPGGTVTLVFTDIEGATRLLTSLGSRYEAVFADHRRNGMLAGFASRVCDAAQPSGPGASPGADA